jgi:hypothetical protein
MSNIITESMRRLRLLNTRRDYQTVFGTPEGQRVLKDILRRAGVTHPKFNSDPMVTAFNEGARHFASSIFRQVHTSTDQLPDFIAEETRRIIEEQHESHQ